MSEYVIATDRLELPRHTWFTTVCRYPYEFGSLVVFEIGRRRSIGRWFPNVGGFNWILLPGKLLCLIGRVIRIIGEVMVTKAIQPCWN